MDTEVEDLLSQIKARIESYEKKEELSQDEVTEQLAALRKRSRFVHNTLSVIITLSILSVTISLI